MGASASSPQASGTTLTVEELTVMEACTCLRQGELDTLLQKFVKLGGVRHTEAATEAKFAIRANSEGAIPKVFPFPPARPR